MPGRRRDWATGGLAAFVLAAAGLYYFVHASRPLPIQQIRQLADAEQWDAADREIRKLLARSPSNSQGLLLAARIAAGRGNLDQCIAFLEAVPDDGADKLEAMVRHAQALQFREQFGEAVRVFQAALDRAYRRGDSNSVLVQRAQEELADVLTLLQRRDQAAAVLWQLFPAHQQKWKLLIQLARLQVRSADPSEAIRRLGELLSRHPADIDLQRALGQAYVEGSRWHEALECIGKVAEQNPADPTARRLHFLCYAALHRWDSFDRLLADDGGLDDDVDVLRSRAARSIAAGDWPAAEAQFTKGIAVDPFDTVTRFQYAQALTRIGDKDAARKQHEEFRRLDRLEARLSAVLQGLARENPDLSRPVSPEACLEMAGICRGLGRARQARAWAEEALRRRPDDPTAREMLDQLPNAVHGQTAR
jgi:tetratricopeptide (TPR) repeat protein